MYPTRATQNETMKSHKNLTIFWAKRTVVKSSTNLLYDALFRHSRDSNPWAPMALNWYPH